MSKMSNRVEFQLNDFVQVGDSGRKGKIVNIVRPFGRYNIYKIQLLDDVVSAALHELVKGMPDCPDLSLMAECESPVVEQYIAASQSKKTLTATVSCVSQTASTQSSAFQNPASQILVESSENDSIQIQPELVLPTIHRKERFNAFPRKFKINL